MICGVSCARSTTSDNSAFASAKPQVFFFLTIMTSLDDYLRCGQLPWRPARHVRLAGLRLAYRPVHHSRAAGLCYSRVVSRTVFGFALVLGPCLIGCAHAPPALYAGWEPMNAGIPKIASSADALRRLEQSRAIWRAWRPGSFDDRSGLRIEQVKGKYSYVRAQQLAKDHIEFTLFVVSADDRVILRALISTDPARLDHAHLKPPPGARWSRTGSSATLTLASTRAVPLRAAWTACMMNART